MVDRCATVAPPKKLPAVHPSLMRNYKRNRTVPGRFFFPILFSNGKLLGRTQISSEFERRTFRNPSIMLRKHFEINFCFAIRSLAEGTGAPCERCFKTIIGRAKYRRYDLLSKSDLSKQIFQLGFDTIRFDSIKAQVFE